MPKWTLHATSLLLEEYPRVLFPNHTLGTLQTYSPMIMHARTSRLLEGLIALVFTFGLFAFAGSVHAATLYYVGTTNAYTTAASWHSEDKACDDTGDGAAPGDGDTIIFGDLCDTAVTLPAAEVLAGFQMEDNYSGTVTAGATSLDVNGNFTVGSTGTFNLNATAMTLSGNFTKGAGTFTHSDGSVDLDGSSQTITGSPTFYTLTKTETSSTTLKIASGATVTITNALTLTGSTGALIAFEATTGGSAATIAISGATITVNHITVKDIAVTGGTILCDTACTNRGNNTGWTIPADSETTTSDSNFTLNSVLVSEPNGGETLTGGAVTTITWDAAGNADSVSLYYSTDAGLHYTLIVADEDLQGDYEWTVPNVGTRKGMVKAMAVNANGDEILSDASDRVFTIVVSADVGEGQAPPEQEIEGQDDGAAFVEINMVQSNGTTIELESGRLFRGVTHSGVYLINADGTRSVFPNETTFNSYGYSIANVVTVNDDQLQKLALGARVRMKAGSLIKLQYDPKVYEVDADGVIHHVPDEAMAIYVYGVNWATKVVDVSDVFWGDYTVGSEIAGMFES